MNHKGLRGVPLLVGVLALVPYAAQAEISELEVEMSGAEVPGGGDPDGSATFKAEFDTEYGDLCYTVTVSRVTGAQGVHIHEAAAGETGKSIIDLQITGRDGDLCRANQPELLTAILDKPWDYYIDVHSAANPDGAVRGQLGIAPPVEEPIVEPGPFADDDAAVEGEAAPAEESAAEEGEVPAEEALAPVEGVVEAAEEAATEPAIPDETGPGNETSD